MLLGEIREVEVAGEGAGDLLGTFHRPRRNEALRRSLLG